MSRAAAAVEPLREFENSEALARRGSSGGGK